MNGNILITICLLLMIVFLTFRRKRYHVPMVQVIPMAVCVAGMGLLGTYILYFLENGLWYGRSFFGAVLFFPILLLPVAWIFRISLTNLLSYATIPGVALLAVYKWNCYLEGCCDGKTLWFTENGIPVHFPSQLAEMTTAILITVLLLVLERKTKLQDKIYPICLIVYGSTRCVLNHYRWAQPEFLLGMTPGVFWSVVAMGIGAVWLIVYRFKKGIY